MLLAPADLADEGQVRTEYVNLASAAAAAANTALKHSAKGPLASPGTRLQDELDAEAFQRWPISPRAFLRPLPATLQAAVGKSGPPLKVARIAWRAGVGVWKTRGR